MKIKLKNIDKAKEINIVVAMKREATALIKYWGLKPSNISKKIFLNKEKKINLLISGIGKNNAEEGTIFLAEITRKKSFFFIFYENSNFHFVFLGDDVPPPSHLFPGCAQHTHRGTRKDPRVYM